MLTPPVIENDGIPAYIPELSVEQYHLLIREAVLPEGAPIELIEGQLVWKDRRDRAGSIMTVGPRHASTIRKISRILGERLRNCGGFVMTQQPITLLESEPEPDVCVVFRAEDHFEDHHPVGPDVALCVEVADSSLKYDRTTKLQVYARAGIAEYWIVNLRENQVEVYRKPDAVDAGYSDNLIVTSGGAVSLRVIDEEFAFSVSEFLSDGPPSQKSP